MRITGTAKELKNSGEAPPHFWPVVIVAIFYLLVGLAGIGFFILMLLTWNS